ncbi:MAG: hypothetical protein NC203_10905 [Firmicutes bacterium]|nr:hypothetical protein [[Eubacterium] siraeum]MCM1488862.1 hypothetical protein [Bacillota bacterium]
MTVRTIPITVKIHKKRQLGGKPINGWFFDKLTIFRLTAVFTLFHSKTDGSMEKTMLPSCG